jgi:hypothetical protein
MTIIWGIVAAIGLGVLTNELCDLAPWLARLLLRRAASLEAKSPEEAMLIYDEMAATLDEVPGKLTKLLFAAGRMTLAFRHLRWRPRTWGRPSIVVSSTRFIYDLTKVTIRLWLLIWTTTKERDWWPIH